MRRSGVAGVVAALGTAIVAIKSLNDEYPWTLSIAKDDEWWDKRAEREGRGKGAIR